MKTSEKRLRAVIYLRVSGQEQKKSGLGMRVQFRQCRAYCAMKNFQVVGIFRDPGVSASTPLERRRRGSAMLQQVENFDCVVTLKLDRMFRNTIDCLTTVDSLDEQGKSLHILDVGGGTIDSRSAAGRFMLTVLAAAAEMERTRTGERMRETLAEVKRRGGRIGPAGFGFQNKGHFQHELHPTEKDAVGLILGMKDDFSLREICKTLNLSDWRPRGGGFWFPNQVRRVIRRAK